MAERLSTGLRNKYGRAGGMSIADCLANGRLDIRSGSQPATADAVEIGTLLASITLNHAAFTPGVATNGINLDTCVDGFIYKAVAEVWQALGLAIGTMGWFRFYDNTVTTGASTTAVRYDGAIATSGSELDMTNLVVAVGGLITIDDFYIQLPAM